VSWANAAVANRTQARRIPILENPLIVIADSFIAHSSFSGLTALLPFYCVGYLSEGFRAAEIPKIINTAEEVIRNQGHYFVCLGCTGDLV
jgi:hypothetical protein